jgi:hypothetical protein
MTKSQELFNIYRAIQVSFSLAHRDTDEHCSAAVGATIRSVLSDFQISLPRTRIRA